MSRFPSPNNQRRVAAFAAQPVRMKPGDKDVDTLTSARMIGDLVMCTGGYTFTPASGGSQEKGFWTKVGGKVGGEWKILNHTYNLAAPQ